MPAVTLAPAAQRPVHIACHSALQALWWMLPGCFCPADSRCDKRRVFTPAEG